MRHSGLIGCLGVAASLLLAGCQSSAPKSSAGPAKPVLVTAEGIPVEKWDLTLDKAGEQRVEAFARFSAGISLELQEKGDEALEEFFRSALSDPKNEQLVLDVARRLMQARQLEKAAVLLAESGKNPDASANMLTLLGAVYALQDRVEDSVAANRRAMQKAPKSLGPYRNLVDLYLKKENHAAALNTLNEASKVEGATPDYYLGLAELYGFYLRSKPDQAELVKPNAKAALDKVYEAKPENAEVLQKLAEGYQFIKDTARATNLYLELLKRFPNAPGLKERLTNLFIQGGEKDKAIDLLQKMIRENPTRHPEAYFILANLLREEKKYTEAADQLERMLIVKDDAEPAYYELAEIHNLNEKPEQAMLVLDKAKRRFGESFVNRFYRAITYNRLKKYDLAVEQLTAAEIMARATAPERLTAQFYFQMGAAFERNKQHDQAVTYFEKSIELEPDFAEAMNYLGYMWAERGENLERAKVLIEKALNQEPENAAFLDSMAWVLFKLNQPKPALEWMLKAMKHVEEEDATLFDHLGDIYASMKDYGKAREAWEKSLKIEVNNDVKKKLDSVPK
ncbi:MAG TPA: tetratricopeptide repeat protein [Verrucomicrobiae bacterium]